MLNSVNQYIDTHESEMMELWRQIVLIESPSNHKPGVDRVGKVLEQFCREMCQRKGMDFDTIYKQAQQMSKQLNI